VKVANPRPIRPVPMTATFTASPVSGATSSPIYRTGPRGSPCRATS
jgi:hypothetical protein